MDLGLLHQLQIFLQLHLIELLGFLGGLGLLKLQHLIYLRLLTGFGILVFFSFEWFQMGRLHKNIQLMQEFLKAPFLVLHFSYYTLMTFLMMLPVILLSMLVILLSVLSVTRHLICGNNQNWLLNLNLIYKALWIGAGGGFLISMLEKLNWFHLTSLTTLVLLT